VVVLGEVLVQPLLQLVVLGVVGQLAVPKMSFVSTRMFSAGRTPTSGWRAGLDALVPSGVKLSASA
jgi:hypothetical protein